MSIEEHPARIVETLDAAAAARRFKKGCQPIARPSPNNGFGLDPDRIFARGAVVAEAGRYAHLTRRERPVLVIPGDLAVDGVLELDEGARLIVLGDLRAGNIVSNGDLYVVGELTVPGVVYAADENYVTLIGERASVEVLLLAYNHQYVEYARKFGQRSARVCVSGEHEGEEAIAARLARLGFTGVVTLAGVASFLRGEKRGERRTVAKKIKPAGKKTPAKKVAAKKVAAKTVPGKKVAAKKITSRTTAMRKTRSPATKRR